MVEAVDRFMTLIAHCQREGWALVSSLLGEVELETLRLEADRLWAQRSLFAQRGVVTQSPMRNDRLDPVIDISAPFGALAGDARLLAVVSELLGGEAQLMKDKFIAKPPGTSGYTAHQDGAYWQGMGLELGRVLTAVLFMDDSPAEKGAIECAPHPDRLLTDPGVVADVDEAAVGPFRAIEAKAGDLLLLHALVPHRSGPNRSSDMRRTLMFTYGVDPRPDLYAIYHRAREA
jgi:ectoine hydroxylase-related dioxygenase (phytanoyl-CoA dioxygenase family)